MKTDTTMPTQEEVSARSSRPAAHLDDVIVGIGEFVYWKPRSQWTPDDGRVFYDGDYRDVLNADDPRIVAALKAAQ